MKRTIKWMCAAVALAAFALRAETIGNVTFTPTHVWIGKPGFSVSVR